MSEIPKDVYAAAYSAADYIEGDGEPGGGYSWSSIILAIARAILAERQRCADVADKLAERLWEDDTGPYGRIREAILAGEQS